MCIASNFTYYFRVLNIHWLHWTPTKTFIWIKWNTKKRKGKLRAPNLKLVRYLKNWQVPKNTQELGQNIHFKVTRKWCGEHKYKIKTNLNKLVKWWLNRLIAKPTSLILE